MKWYKCVSHSCSLVLDVRPVAEIVHNFLVAYSQECSQLEINDEIIVLVIS